MVLRLVFFLVGAVVLSRLLAHLPLVGGLFGRTGLLGIWLAALLLSFVLTRLGARAVRVRRDRAELHRLEAVDSPRNHGKIGSLLHAQGRPRKALAHLEQAARGEPQVAEWHHRLGLARLALGENEAARAALERATALDAEHAFGAAQLRLAQACLAAGDAEAALAALAVFERNHGPSPESAYRRAVAARRLRREGESRAAFDELAQLVARAPRYQRAAAERWRWKGRLARLGR